MRIYLDTCCYNRPFDKSQEKSVKDEINAIVGIVQMAEKNYCVIIGSDVLRQEISAVKNSEKKIKLSDLYTSLFCEEIHYSDNIEIRAKFFMTEANIKTMDAFHIAYAEAGEIDYFLTTDYRLIKSCEKLALNLKVVNPVNFLLNGGLEND